MSKYIYLSPHLDDVVLSCGGILSDQVRRRESVQVWTIFAGDPPVSGLSPLAKEIHARWQTGPQAAAARRAEDQLACERLLVTPRHFDYLDCIYRTRYGTSQALIEKNEELFQPLPASEQPLIDIIAVDLHHNLPADCTLVLPLGIGGHIDHQAVRRAGEQLDYPRLYYADFPYLENITATSDFLPPESYPLHFPLNNPSLAAWQYAIEAYTSQISTFWPSLKAMYHAVETYAQSEFGNCLWQIHS